MRIWNGEWKFLLCSIIIYDILGDDFTYSGNQNDKPTAGKLLTILVQSIVAEF